MFAMRVLCMADSSSSSFLFPFLFIFFFSFFRSPSVGFLVSLTFMLFLILSNVFVSPGSFDLSSVRPKAEGRRRGREEDRRIGGRRRRRTGDWRDERDCFLQRPSYRLAVALAWRIAGSLAAGGHEGVRAASFAGRAGGHSGRLA